MQDALRLNLNWFAGGLEPPGQLGLGGQRVPRRAAGLASHVLCFRTVWEGTAQGDKGRSAVMPGIGGRVGGGRAAAGRRASCSGRCPYGAPSAANWIAMMAQRHFHEFGTTREQLAQIALNARAQRRAQPEGRSTATR